MWFRVLFVEYCKTWPCTGAEAIFPLHVFVRKSPTVFKKSFTYKWSLEVTHVPSDWKVIERTATGYSFEEQSCGDIIGPVKVAVMRESRRINLMRAWDTGPITRASSTAYWRRTSLSRSISHHASVDESNPRKPKKHYMGGITDLNYAPLNIDKIYQSALSLRTRVRDECLNQRIPLTGLSAHSGSRRCNF